MTFVATSDGELQTMLNVASDFAYRWHYSFNAKKSKGNDFFGESSASRKVLRKSCL